MLTPKKVYWDRSLTIIWLDDSVSKFNFYALRLYCPCAECVDELSGERVIRPESVSPTIHLVDCSYVGNYSLRFEWSDKHSKGIYSFNYLKNLSSQKEFTIRS